MHATVQLPFPYVYEHGFQPGNGAIHSGQVHRIQDGPLQAHLEAIPSSLPCELSFSMAQNPAGVRPNERGQTVWQQDSQSPCNLASGMTPVSFSGFS